MMRSRRGVLVLFALGLIQLLLTGASPPDGSPPPSPPVQPASTYTLESQVVSAAGSPGSGSGVQANGSLGQPAPVGYGGTAGFELFSGFWYTRYLPTSGIDVPGVEPYLNRLVGARPNPFNPMTEIVFSVSAETIVTLRVHDLQGRRVRTLTREMLAPGLHHVTWNGRDDSGRELPSGVYFVRFTAGSEIQTSKILLLK